MTIIEQWFSYLSFCIESPISAPACRPFWTWVMVALFAVGAIIVVAIFWKLVSYKFKLRAALRAQAKREAVADETTMEQHRWIGDNVNVQDDKHAEIRIRAALDRRKSANVDPIV